MNGAVSRNDVYSDWFKRYLDYLELDSVIEPLSLEEINEEWQNLFARKQLPTESYDWITAYLEGFDSIHGTVETDYRLSVEEYNEELRKLMINVVNIRSDRKPPCPISA
jgi:TorA maturation chaperone TorD